MNTEDKEIPPLKTIGLIGGMSWESTQTYYRLINQGVREQLGGLHSARLVLCTNTMHKVAPAIEQAAGIPLLHIADATVSALKVDGITRVGLLGTRFTMEQAFYVDRLRDHGIEVLVPDDAQRYRIHSVIYSELCQGMVNAQSKAGYLEIAASLAERGAQGVILGCTEIGLLIQGADTDVPLYDTTEIHADQAVIHALGRAR